MFLISCINIALEKNLTSIYSLSREAYPLLKEYRIPSYYYPEIMNKALALVRSYRKRIRKGKKATKPQVKKMMLSTYYGFKIKNGKILIPVSGERYGRGYEEIELNNYVQGAISTVKVHSFALNTTSLSLTIGKDIEVLECTTTVGVDRNIKNVTVGNETHHKVYDLSDVVAIKKRYRKKISHFKRNDRRIKQKLAMKYGKRSSNRVKQIMHRISKDIVEDAKNNGEAIVLENIKGIRDITERGDYKRKEYRFLFHNAFPYGMLAFQIKYKAAWKGVPVIELSRSETRNTSRECSVCGSLTRIEHGRTLRCDHCGLTIDRDLNAAINISKRGRTRLKRSQPREGLKGPSGEALNQSKRWGADDGK
ncbi:MAG: RNA-guided endonuclease InsQ/TnpB family protein [Thermoplasmata archaeon]|jgi:putative transposase